MLIRSRHRLVLAVGLALVIGLFATAAIGPSTSKAEPMQSAQMAGAGGPGVVKPAAGKRRVAEQPGGGVSVFGRKRFLVAYYGTAGTGALGVLGETSPDQTRRRLRRAAQPFKRPGEKIQAVYELIVTVADPMAGSDGDFNHDIDKTLVRDFIRAAHRHRALVVLDVQPGRANFLDVAQRWKWALRDPWVGLALDPEWRMGPREVPGRVIGSVSAAEVNQVSAWLSRFAVRRRLPQKPFVLHQFRTTMIEDIGKIAARPRLAMIQHTDGFGTPGQKLDTYRVVARPERFVQGFKLFYDEDVPRMTPAQVRAIRPAVRFVSFQ